MAWNGRVGRQAAELGSRQSSPLGQHVAKAGTIERDIDGLGLYFFSLQSLLVRRSTGQSHPHHPISGGRALVGAPQDERAGLANSACDCPHSCNNPANTELDRAPAGEPVSVPSATSTKDRWHLGPWRNRPVSDCPRDGTANGQWKCGAHHGGGRSCLSLSRGAFIY